MDKRVLNIVQGQGNLINQLIDRVIELEKQVKTLKSMQEPTYRSEIEIALENGASLDDMPSK